MLFLSVSKYFVGGISYKSGRERKQNVGDTFFFLPAFPFFKPRRVDT